MFNLNWTLPFSTTDLYDPIYYSNIYLCKVISK